MILMLKKNFKRLVKKNMVNLFESILEECTIVRMLFFFMKIILSIII